MRVVVESSGFAGLRPVFEVAFKYHWPDCPWPVEFVSQGATGSGLFLRDSWILYAHRVMTADVLRAWKTLSTNPGVWKVVLYPDSQPGKFFDGFLGEFVQPVREWAVLVGSEGSGRVLGVYHSPLVFVDLVRDGRLSVSGVRSLAEQRSVVLPMLDKLEGVVL